MIRKVLHIAMSFVLLISLTGFTFHKHYCHGELTDVSVMVDSHHCGMDSCSQCEDIISNCKLEVDLISAEVQNSPQQAQIDLDFAAFFNFELLTEKEKIKNTVFPAIAELNPSLHGISMFQCYLC